MEATGTECQGAKHKHRESVMSRLWDLRSQDQFCDIDIKVGEKVFHCHRNVLSASSEYFRAMFGGSFEESYEKEVTLHEVDVNTFESILLFIYTGDAAINTSNAFDLIHAARFYGLTFLEEDAIEFAMKNVHKFSSEVILKMFTYAHTTGTKSQAFRFFGKFIYDNFGFYSDLPEFINLTWDSLVAVAGLVCGADKMALSDTFVEGTLKWIRGHVDTPADERGPYFKQFADTLHQTKSFTTYAKHMLDQYEKSEKNAVAVLDERPEKLLRVFVTRPRAGECVSGVFTLHEMDTGYEWAYSGEPNLPIRFMKNVVIDDSLYTLIPDEFDRSRVTFIRDRRASSGAPHTSMYQRQSLKRPPFLGWVFEICGKDNNIFAYNTGLTFKDPFSSSGESDFTEEELCRGVMSYRRNVNKWFPVPAPRKYDFSCITCDEKMVYLIGGKHSHGAVQCYDLRTPAWMDLPSTAGIYENAACCIRDGKIWVMGGEMNRNSVEIFDPIARTWEPGQNLILSRSKNSRLIHWNSVHHGRTIVNFTHDCYTNRKILFSSDRCPNGWKTIPGLHSLLKDRTHGLTDSGVVEDMVVF